jgi:hypothetical protein
MSNHLALSGDTVQGRCPLSHGGSGPQDFTGTWTASSRGVTVGQDMSTYVVFVGDTGSASCGHTFKAMLGGAAKMADGTGIHITQEYQGLKTVSIIENDPDVGVGISITTTSFDCTST